MKSKALNRALVLVGIMGVLVSTYALYVELSAEIHPGYEAMCDLSEYASCSRVLTSEYSKGFGILPEDSPFAVPNCIYGTIFYCLIIFLSTFDMWLVVQLQFLLALTSVGSSIYLAYLLTFVLKDFCVVCVSTYFVNVFLVVLTYKKKNVLTVKNK